MDPQHRRIQVANGVPPTGASGQQTVPTKAVVNGAGAPLDQATAGKTAPEDKDLSRGYKRERILGRGAFGIAYLCKRVSDGALVVMKKNQNRNSSANGEVEARVMQNLVHPHIVRILECWSDDRFRTIVMEYCNGGDLRDAINTRSQEGKPGFPEDTIRRWVAQISYALYYCHVQHVLHRDLKAANVMLHDDAIKVVDFGLSRVLDNTTDFARTSLGSPAYIPPEVITNSPYNSRVDMWSLGVLVYELMTLQRPFNGATLQDIFHSIGNDPTPSLDHLPYSCELKELVIALLQKNPMLRPSSADVLQMPWIQENLDVSFQLQSDDRSKRESRGWRKVRVRAALPDTKMMEFRYSTLSVNRRAEPSMSSKCLGIISAGEIVEEQARIRDELHVRWMKLYPAGYCVADHPTSKEPLFREVAEWRIIRPNAAVPATDAESEVGQLFSPDTSRSEVRGKEVLDDVRCASDLVAATFSPNPPEDDTDILPLWNFLFERLTQEVIQEILAEHRLSARPSDDTSWTIYASDKLRPLKRLACLPVLRAIGIRAKKRQQLD